MDDADFYFIRPIRANPRPKQQIYSKVKLWFPRKTAVFHQHPLQSIFLWNTKLLAKCFCFPMWLVEILSTQKALEQGRIHLSATQEILCLDKNADLLRLQNTLILP